MEVNATSKNKNISMACVKHDAFKFRIHQHTWKVHTMKNELVTHISKAIKQLADQATLYSSRDKTISKGSMILLKGQLMNGIYILERNTTIGTTNIA